VGGEVAWRTRASSPSTRGVWILPSLVIVAFAAVLFYRMKAGPGYPLDDTWIHLAFARNLAAGGGFGINPGQPSTGSTSPLWTLLVSIGFLFGSVQDSWPWVLNTLVLAAAGTAAAWVLSELSGPALDRRWRALLPLAAGLMIVTAPVLVWSTAGAMEIPLFLGLLLAAWAIHVRAERAPARGIALWGIPAGLAILARPEGLLFLALLGLTSRPRAAARNIALALLIYAPYVVYCLAVSGRPFPATFYAKTSHTFAGLPDPGYVAGSAGLLWRAAAPFCVLFLAGVLVKVTVTLWTGIHRQRETTPSSTSERPHAQSSSWRPILPGLLFPFVLTLSYASMGRSFLFAVLPGNFGRYLFPAVGFLAVVGLWGLASSGRLVFSGPTRAHPRARPVGGVLSVAVAALLLWNAAQCVRLSNLYARNVYDINAMQVEMARRLPRHLPSGSQVAANDVGALAFFTDFQVLDLVGIVSPEVQEVVFPLRGQADPPREATLLNLLRHERPAALVVFPRWYANLLNGLGPCLEQMEEIVVPDNRTSGDNRLVAYRIRWK